MGYGRMPISMLMNIVRTLSRVSFGVLVNSKENYGKEFKNEVDVNEKKPEESCSQNSDLGGTLVN